MRERSHADRRARALGALLCVACVCAGCASKAARLTRRARAAAEDGIHVQALDLYQEALDVNPSYAPAYHGRAVIARSATSR